MRRIRAIIIAAVLAAVCVFWAETASCDAPQAADKGGAETMRYIDKAMKDKVVSRRQADSLVFALREALDTWREEGTLNRISGYIDAEYERSLKEIDDMADFDYGYVRRSVLPLLLPLPDDALAALADRHARETAAAEAVMAAVDENLRSRELPAWQRDVWVRRLAALFFGTAQIRQGYIQQVGGLYNVYEPWGRPQGVPEGYIPPDGAAAEKAR